jgi:hypothetical protein
MEITNREFDVLHDPKLNKSTPYMEAEQWLICKNYRKRDSQGWKYRSSYRT